MSLFVYIYLTLGALFANQCTHLFDNQPVYSKEFQSIRAGIISDMNPYIANIASLRSTLKKERKSDPQYPVDSIWMDVHGELMIMKSLIKYEGKNKNAYNLVNELALELVEAEFENFGALDLIIDKVVESEVANRKLDVELSKNSSNVFEKNRRYLSALDLVYDRLNYYKTKSRELSSPLAVIDIQKRISYFMEMIPNVKKLTVNKRADLLSELMFSSDFNIDPFDSKKTIEDFLSKEK